MVVVELNGEIVRRPRLREVPLKTGDQVELVHFVGGG
jgi:thiamine biosynthesis protein ThiS